MLPPPHALAPFPEKHLPTLLAACLPAVDRIIFLHQGRVVWEGSVGEFDTTGKLLSCCCAARLQWVGVRAGGPASGGPPWAPFIMFDVSVSAVTLAPLGLPLLLQMSPLSGSLPAAACRVPSDTSDGL